MFDIADCAVSCAFQLVEIINDDRIKNVYEEVLQDHEAASHWSNALDLLAKLCAGERFLRESNPDVMELNVEALLVWPGQPLQNFAVPMPVLNACYYYANRIRRLCMIDMYNGDWHLDDDPDLSAAPTSPFS